MWEFLNCIENKSSVILFPQSFMSTRFQETITLTVVPYFVPLNRFKNFIHFEIVSWIMQVIFKTFLSHVTHACLDTLSDYQWILQQVLYVLRGNCSVADVIAERMADMKLPRMASHHSKARGRGFMVSWSSGWLWPKPYKVAQITS